MYRTLSTTLRIDSEKARKYAEEHPFCRSEIAKKAGVSVSYFRQTINNGKTNRVYWWAICDALGVPRDYFDYHEPEPEPVPDPEPEKKEEEKPEYGVDLADIQYSLNIFEQKFTQILEAIIEQNNLLSQQNQLLRGKLEKGVRNNEIKGNTNHGNSHSYTIVPTTL